ncbi:hypothetical protein E2C01_061055 [Portunus trituberculatus]|uniref:Uncharacterized protein n=1 Tax=Portunus trituberculatus TaxID=210409 RepID=A0A5B7H472_PORTR|nr:hypothetical protein [Portunus trituberculatus]
MSLGILKFALHSGIVGDLDRPSHHDSRPSPSLTVDVIGNKTILRVFIILLIPPFFFSLTSCNSLLNLSFKRAQITNNGNKKNIKASFAL